MRLICLSTSTSNTRHDERTSSVPEQLCTNDPQDRTFVFNQYYDVFIHFFVAFPAILVQ